MYLASSCEDDQLAIAASFVVLSSVSMIGPGSGGRLAVPNRGRCVKHLPSDSCA